MYTARQQREQKALQTELYELTGGSSLRRPLRRYQVNHKRVLWLTPAPALQVQVCRRWVYI